MDADRKYAIDVTAALTTDAVVIIAIRYTIRPYPIHWKLYCVTLRHELDWRSMRFAATIIIAIIYMLLYILVLRMEGHVQHSQFLFIWLMYLNLGSRRFIFLCDTLRANPSLCTSSALFFNMTWIFKVWTNSPWSDNAGVWYEDEE